MEEQAERSGRGITRVMRGKIIEESKPYLLCVFANICFGGFNIVSKVSLDQGMSCYVLVFYGNAFGTLASAPLALILERKIKRKITLLVLRDIFLFGLLGAVLGRTLYYVGLEETSPTFASAMANLMPSITFVLAVVCRMEKLDMSKHDSIAKVVGTAVAFGGAALMTLYKGIKLISIGALVHIKHSHQINTTTTSKLSLVDKDWIKGSLFLFLSYFSLSAYYILQAKTIKMYPAPITLTSLTCLSGTLLSAIMAAIFYHKASSWKLSWDITLLAPLYSGIVIFAITVYVQTLVTRIRGPVFMTAFRPFATLIVALMGFILGEDLHLGSIVGALLIIVGLYTMLWGKEKEMEKNVMERSDSIPIAHHQEDIEIVKQEK